MDTQPKSCFFIGHREAGKEILPELEDTIRKHISDYGVTQFIVGMYGGFDSLVASVLVHLKAEYPAISILQLIPYHPGERPVQPRDGFDGTYYPFEDKAPPRRLAIVKANEKMIHTCDYLIAYAWHPASNSRELVEKARRLETKGGIQVTNLGDSRVSTATSDI